MSDTFLDVVVFMPLLLVRLSFQFLRFESMKKRAVKTFQKELRAQRLGKEQVDLFTREYESAGSLRELVSNLGRSWSILDFARRD